jgi:TPR repeat protein
MRAWVVVLLLVMLAPRAARADSHRAEWLVQMADKCDAEVVTWTGVVARLDSENWAKVSDAMAARVETVKTQLAAMAAACSPIRQAASSMQGNDLLIEICHQCYEWGDEDACLAAESVDRCNQRIDENDVIYTGALTSIQAYDDAKAKAYATATEMDAQLAPEQAAADAKTFADLSTKCDDGDARSCLIAGDYLWDGRGVEKSEKKGKEMWARSVKLFDRDCKKKRDVDACKLLAEFYERGDEATGKSEKKAKEYRALEKKLTPPTEAELAAAKERAAVVAALPDECSGGSADACEQLGDAYAAGDGIKKSKKLASKYWKLAIKLLDRACRKDDDVDACENLATAYESARLGVKTSAKKAKKYRALEGATGSMNR